MIKLVKFEANYADEFDVESFAIMDEEQYREFESKFEEIKKYISEGNEFYVGVGPNEDICFEDADKFDKRFGVKEISEEVADILQKYVCCRYSGMYMYGEPAIGIFDQILEFKK